MENTYKPGPLTHSLSWLLVLALMLTTGAVQAQSDFMNLENNFGVRLEDAYATGYRNREAQTYVRYERDAKGRNTTLLVPAMEIGPFRNTQFSVAVPIRTGNGDRTGSGNIEVSGLYNFNTEGLYLPAVSLAAQADIPTGLESSGLDYTLRFAATKTITRMRPTRIHANVRYTRNAQPSTSREGNELMTERAERWVGIVGISTRLAPQTLIVVDFIREQFRPAGEMGSSVELGFRRQMNPRLVMSLGGTAGLGEQAPSFRANVGLQQAL